MHRPCQAARPRAERRIALLRAAIAEGTVVAVEHRFVTGSSTNVVDVRAVAVEQDVLICAERVQHKPLEQVGRAIAFVHQLMPQLPGDAEDAKRSHRVHEQRVRTVERVNVAAPRRPTIDSPALRPKL